MAAPTQHPAGTVVVAGTGPACAGIAQVIAGAGYHTILCGHSDGLEAARAEIDGGRFGLLAAADAGRISSDERFATLERLGFSDDPAEAGANVDLAVVSDPGQTETLAPLLRDLETHLPAGAVLAVDSVGEPLAALAEGLQRPGRLVGWHWGRPPPLNKLAEIVAGAATSPAAVELVVQVARRAGKNPVVIADAPGSWGYVTNRIWSALQAEAGRILADGVAGANQVDRLVVDCFGWPSGPFGRGTEPH